MTLSQDPWIENFADTTWSRILEIEQQWKKEKGYV